MTDDRLLHDRLHEAVLGLRRAVAGVRVPLDAAGAQDARVDATAVLGQLDDHVIARVANLDAPALVVVGGSTGSGKSLLVSSMVGRVVSPSGVLRPTTRSPVLVHHPDAAPWFSAGTILPGMARVTRTAGVSDRAEGDSTRELRLVASDALPAGIALLDAPDIDSIDHTNRELAAQLLAAADVWVFVTTAARYADAVPWWFLTRARERGAPLVLVLNRVPAGVADEVAGDLRRLLGEHGLGSTEVFVVEEQDLEAGRLLPGDAGGLRSWLTRLGADHELRAETVRRSLRGVLEDLVRRCGALAVAADAQRELTTGLRDVSTRAYARAAEAVAGELANGALLRGEVLARWEEFVGTGELLRQLRTGIGRVRDRVVRALTGRPKTQDQLNVAVESVLEQLVRNLADQGAAETAHAWRSRPGSAPLAAAMPAGLDRSSPDLAQRTAAMIREWQGELLELVRTKGAARRTTARVASLGVNGVSAVLMMLVFSHTGGLTGGEVAVAGGASAVGHAILEALFGDENLRRLANQAREDLLARVASLYDTERSRFDAVLDAMGLDHLGGDEVRDAVRALTKAMA
jgi:hypothetical protein